MKTPREIIAEAWAMTKKESQLRRWGYISAVLETLLNIKLLIYQAWFLVSYMQGDPIGFFTIEAIIFEHVPFGVFVTLAVIFCILVVVEWLFPHMATGAIIGLAAKKHKGEEVKGGLVLALYNFFPIFAIHEVFFISRITVVVTLSSILLRYMGGAAFLGIAIICTLYVFSNILKFLFIFGEEAVVIRKKGIRDALASSFKIVISYLGHVVFLMLLFVIITLRIILNAIMIFLIPGIVIGIGFVLAAIMPAVIGYTIGALLGLILVGIASYFFAYLEVFRQTVWTLTYLELSAQKELDIIEE